MIKCENCGRIIAVEEFRGSCFRCTKGVCVHCQKVCDRCGRAFCGKHSESVKQWLFGEKREITLCKECMEVCKKYL